MKCYSFHFLYKTNIETKAWNEINKDHKQAWELILPVYYTLSLFQNLSYKITSYHAFKDFWYFPVIPI